MARKKVQPDFHVALSFAGEDRAYVEEVAMTLRKMGLRVFYDKYEVVSLWGKDLYSHLIEIYFQRARYTVMFISKHYKRKLWANHERRAAQARAFQEHQEYVLPVRFDRTQIPGILPTTGYISLKDYSPVEFARLVKQKVGNIERPGFFPDELDRLYEYLRISKRNKRQRQEVHLLAEVFFDSLKLMTVTERHILTVAIKNTCAAGPPNNAHLKIDVLSRLTSLSSRELRSLFARLDCLYIKSKIYDSCDHENDNKLTRTSKVIEITYEPIVEDFTGNATFIMLAIFECIFDNLCPTCGQRAIEILDFSALSTLAGTEEKY
jgi:hypothetical protein